MTANPFAAARSANPAAKGEVFSTPPVEGGDPFATPTGPAGDKITDMVGELLLVRPTEYIASMITSNGETDAFRVDVTPLTGPRAGEMLADMMVFQLALKRDLKRIYEGPSNLLLGRLALGAKKPGKNAPYVFEMPTEEDKSIARAHLAKAAR